MKTLFIIGIVLIAAIDRSESKRFTECELARLLHNKYHFSRASLPNWLCLIRSESGYSTRAINRANRNGSWDFGLFQINDRYWCGRGHIGGTCHINCSAFLSDDITASVQCAAIIFRRQGFGAWYGWKNHCQRGLPSIKHCF